MIFVYWCRASTTNADATICDIPIELLYSILSLLDPLELSCLSNM